MNTLRKSKMFSNQIYYYCLIVFVAVVGFIQLLMINKLRFVPSFDLDAIYGGAIQWVETGSFQDYYDYYEWFPNNLGGLCFFYIVFKVGSFFCTDYFTIAASTNMVMLLVTMVLTSLTTRKLWGNKCGILTLVLFLCMPTFYFMPDAFYTDSLSIVFPIGLFYLSLKIEESKSWKALMLCIFSGFVASVGSLIKPTVMIMAVAISISFLLRNKWKKLGIYIVSIGLIYLIITTVFRGYFYGTHLSLELAKVKNTPVYHWIMMGLNGNGGYNPGDYEFTRSFTDPVIRDAALRNEIINRVTQKGLSGMLVLYIEKLFRCFGDGTLGISDFLDDSPCTRSVIHDYILYDGSKYTVYRTLCNVVFYAFLLFMAIDLVFEICKGREFKGQGNYGISAAVFAIAGIAVFLMHWETSPRYITNYVPVILVLATGGIRNFINWIIGRKSKENENYCQ